MIETETLKEQDICDCGSSFFVQRRNGIVVSHKCVDCRCKHEREQRIVSREKAVKNALKSQKSALRKIKSIGGKPKLNKADKIFSLYVRQRDADENGIIRCISCGAFRQWRKADCGHFLKRQHMATRFDEVNCNCQCKPCNGFEQGNNVGYRIGLIKKYGLEAVEKLEGKQNNTCHMDQFMIDLIEKEYKEKCIKLGYVID